MATANCPFSEDEQGIIQLTILNEPFRYLDKTVETNTIRLLQPTLNDAVLAVTPRGRNLGGIYYLFQTNQVRQGEHTIYSFNHDCLLAQDTPLLQVRNETWMACSYVSSSSDVSSSDTWSTDTWSTDLISIDIESGRITHQLTLPNEYQVFMQSGFVSKDNTTVVLHHVMRSDINAIVTETRINERTSSMTVLNKYERHINTLCSFGSSTNKAWMITGTQVLDVWVDGVWQASVMPPRANYSWHPGSCAISETKFVVTWYLDWVYKGIRYSQYNWHVYDTKTMEKLDSISSAVQRGVDLFDRVTAIQFFSSDRIGLATSGYVKNGMLFESQYEFWEMGENGIEIEKKANFTAPGSGLWMSMDHQGYVSGCGKLCHLNQACAGGITYVFSLLALV